VSFRKSQCVTLMLVLVLAACGESSADRADGLAEQADAFLADMYAGAWTVAYSRLDDERQAECGSAQNLADVVQGAGMRPATWTLREPTVRKQWGLISGTMEKTDGSRGIAEFSLSLVDDEWRINAWSLDNRDLCLEAQD
jgi:hypothetical protein